MRIVLVNWARIWEGAAHGGGVNVYCQQLALELVARGHEVSWVSAGLTYTPDGYAPNKLGPCTARRHGDYHGVRTFEIINSPVVAPGPCQFDEPLAEASSPVLEAEFARLLGLLSPDIVHFHNLEGFSAGCIYAARAAGARVVFSLHNYHTVCQQVYLMRAGTTPCHDFEGGQACVGCVNLKPAQDERLHRATYHAPPPVPEPDTTPLRLSIAQRLGLSAVLPPPARPVPVMVPGRPVTQLADIMPDPEPRRAASAAPAAPEGYVLDVESPAWRPLSNEVRVTAGNLATANPFGQRRALVVRALSACDRVIAVSGFVARKFESLGVDAKVLRTIPIGSRMTELGAVVRAEAHPAAPARPLKLVFMGFNNFYKGLHMLCDSLEVLTPEVLAQIHLCVYAKDIHVSEHRLRALEPRLAALSTSPSYTYDQIPAMLRGKDAGIVPSVWWDNGPQTVMEFLACGLPVIGANLGGIPDFIRHEVNGLLFTGNDRFDLAANLARVVADRTILPRLRAGVEPPRTVAAHVGDLEALYSECLLA